MRIITTIAERWRGLLALLLAGWLVSGCGWRHPIGSSDVAVEVVLKRPFVAQVLAGSARPDSPSLVAARPDSRSSGVSSGPTSFPDDGNAILIMLVLFSVVAMVLLIVGVSASSDGSVTGPCHVELGPDGPVSNSYHQRIGWGENVIAVPTACFGDNGAAELVLEVRKGSRSERLRLWVDRRSPRLVLR